MNIAVTGATSFIGVPMIGKLLEQGHEVYGIVRPRSTNIGRLSQLRRPPAAEDEGQVLLQNETTGGRGHLHIVEADLGSLDRADFVIPEPCREFYHFGWDGAGSHNRTNRDVQQKNVEDSLKVLEGARRLGCEKFLFSGSQAEYGICQEAMTEDTPLMPVSEYAKAKVDFFRQAKAQADRWNEGGYRDISCIHARIFSVYGPGDHPWSLVESCLRAFSEGGYLSLGECTQMWNFLHVHDLVELLAALMDGPQEGAYEVYNAAGPAKETRPLREYVRTMYELLGFHGSYSFGRRPQNAEGPANLIPDISKLENAVGWKQKISFEDGIRQMAQNRK